jgi:predicted nucleic acid-binding protein
LIHIVLDASAAVEISLRTPQGRRLQMKLPTDAETWVPEHYFAETTAVLRRLELNGSWTATQIQVALSRIMNAPVRRVSVRPLIPDAWALRHNLTMADAFYVVVAQHLDAPLVTCDAKLANSPNLTVETLIP